MSEHEDRPTQPPRRRDPLSLALGASVLVLALMYAFDELNQRAFDAHAASVSELVRGRLATAECVVSPVGHTGEQALLMCDGVSASDLRDQLVSQWSTAPPSPTFSSFALRDPEQTLICDRSLEHCQRAPLPNQEFFKEHKRRKPRE